jgi:hypothetical protein
LSLLPFPEIRHSSNIRVSWVFTDFRGLAALLAGI